MEQLQSIKSGNKQVAYKYYEGAEFGMITVVGRAPARGQNKYVYCKCACGNPDIFEVFIGNLGKGHTQSCGCLQIDSRYKHGMSEERVYKIHKSMLQRCYNKKHKNYDYYGGRGISVCKRWMDFKNFFEDMGHPPSDDFTLDRKDFDLGYFPENCEWVDKTIQAYNQKKRVDNTSGRTGVTPTDSGKWSVRISYYKEIIHLGTFEAFEAACKAREEAELKYYGKTKE